MLKKKKKKKLFIARWERRRQNNGTKEDDPLAKGSFYTGVRLYILYSNNNDYCFALRSLCVHRDTTTIIPLHSYIRVCKSDVAVHVSSFPIALANTANPRLLYTHIITHTHTHIYNYDIYHYVYIVMHTYTRHGRVRTKFLFPRGCVCTECAVSVASDITRTSTL